MHLVFCSSTRYTYKWLKLRYVIHAMKNSSFSEGEMRGLSGIHWVHKSWISCQQTSLSREQTSGFQLCAACCICTCWLISGCSPEDPVLDNVTEQRVYSAELRGLNWQAPMLLGSRALEAETPACLRSGFPLWLILIMAFSTNPGFPGWAS